jgi:TonB family protein
MNSRRKFIVGVFIATTALVALVVVSIAAIPTTNLALRAALDIGNGKIPAAQREGACERPNVAATTLRVAEPDTPEQAQREGISGTVQVVVSLDANSHVRGTRIGSSPSTVLNAAALAAARESTFQTEIRNCRPVAADYIFSVDFTNQ